eukprot:751634-Hanusia_phi.AAC.1
MSPRFSQTVPYYGNSGAKPLILGLNRSGAKPLTVLLYFTSSWFVIRDNNSPHLLQRSLLDNFGIT